MFFSYYVRVNIAKVITLLCNSYELCQTMR
ncbi:hypothetical protein EV693_102241 [Nicoletella semolina]|uniref:Uncharacterized protein n=1 Tax=Nicoletella semolina TaxID=271160 RepID=A0A4R2NBN3_9PAST|nr:hypothetical protein EV693_102241 [Nicoletella semolina]